MLTITHFTCENIEQGCVTDSRQPRFSYALESTNQAVTIVQAALTVNGWRTDAAAQNAIRYQGAPLEAYHTYTAELTVTDNYGETAQAQLTFETGRMGEPWTGAWISDASYHFTEKKVSPTPMMFRKTFSIEKKVKKAAIYATAIGIYELFLNEEKVGDRYFAPGFTSYKNQLQYQTYDVTAQLQAGNTLTAVVAGGWAVGSFVFTRKNRITAKRQAFLLELHLTYEDGSSEVIGTDENWEVTRDSAYRAADFYDGETYDATVQAKQCVWRSAAVEPLTIHPQLLADYGAPVRAHERLQPISCTQQGECLIYDFGQNFAGVVELTLNGKEGQTVTVRHAEVLNADGTINTAFLRSAKATVTYLCRDGRQTYSPRLTYMGFRYISIEGIGQQDITVSAIALYSDVARSGDFRCSDARLNRLQDNILWSSRSNFMDIPTDCPQRDERMGWTGDIAVFAPTACCNFDMRRFLEKWLRDMASEQLPTGGIPNTIPAQGYGFPATMPTMAIDFWGDACVLVPWAMYQAYGDTDILRQCYPMMKKYVKACQFWAGLTGTGKRRYIWDTPSVLHFGDWVAPDVPQMSQWQKRSKWTATASLKNTSGILAKVARILEQSADAEQYGQLSERVADAYRAVFTDGEGRLLEEFQTAYVLPLYFSIFQGEEKKKAAAHLAELVQKSDYCIGTGFPGTPYLLFALADNGYADVAYRMLLNEKCPSWLYEVKMGATTIWERWDGMDENGQCPIGDDGTDLMISYNHYASGAVGDFLYRRVAGIEALEAGYRRFRVAPLIGGGLVQAQAHVGTPYGELSAAWELHGQTIEYTVTVPVGTQCEVLLPNGELKLLPSGHYTLKADADDKERGDGN